MNEKFLIRLEHESVLIELSKKKFRLIFVSSDLYHANSPRRLAIKIAEGRIMSQRRSICDGKAKDRKQSR